ncbi:DUF1769-domain-containing protein [Calocera cornea HHB12733]|uniref:DUF1769-domain-containing protein n=1 Tax=Calocera cornea HHB12733 TaxID=1353952 RepID=A0A165DLZ9_9BASI|nr:DUF1769-domain-containing protein [Calocera cornea HHB12733]
MVHLRVTAGTSLATLAPIPVNTDEWTDISSRAFQGRLAVQINGYVGPNGNRAKSKYFERPDRKGKTWSIAFQGRFLEEISADDLLFGNTFDRPITLPWGSSAVLSFMSLVDPTLSHDLSAKRPWALSPAISSFPFMAHARGTVLPEERHPSEVLGEGGWEMYEGKEGAGAGEGSGSLSGGSGSTSGTSTPRKGLDGPAERKSWFGKVENRRAVTFGPDDIITGDFCHSFLHFPDLSLVLPGGIRFDLKRYWDGQPVRFVCLRRPEKGVMPQDSEVFWAVQLEIVEDVEVVRGMSDEEDEEDEEDEDEDDEEDDEEYEDAEGGEDEDDAEAAAEDGEENSARTAPREDVD